VIQRKDATHGVAKKLALTLRDLPKPFAPKTNDDWMRQRAGIQFSVGGAVKSAWSGCSRGESCHSAGDERNSLHSGGAAAAAVNSKK
jgi:hypothetical protein